MKLTLSNERIVNTINTLGELSNAKLPVKQLQRILIK